MERQIFEVASGIGFLLVQIFAIATFFVIRYHFQNFGAPGDRRARMVVRIFGTGILIFFFTATFLMAEIILST